MHVLLLVDTGSNITILNPAVMDKLDEATRPAIEPVENRMVLADGSAKPFFGRGTFDLEIEGHRARHEIWIADIEVDGILGMDYLRKHGCNIGPGPEGDLKLSISNPSTNGTEDIYTSFKQTSAETSPSSHQCYRVAVQETVVIPANSEMVTAARVLDLCEEDGVGVLEPTMEFVHRSKLLVGRTLVNMGKNCIPIRLFNPTSYPRTVYRNTVAALCEPVQEVQNMGDATGTNVRLAQVSQPREFEENAKEEDQGKDFPTELSELVRRSTDGLDSAQTEALTNLLKEYQDIFATTSNPLGRTNIESHNIDTGDARPIKQAPRRLPFHLKEQAEEEVKKMLAKMLASLSRHLVPGLFPWSWYERRTEPFAFVWTIANSTALPLRTPIPCQELQIVWMPYQVRGGLAL